MKVSELMELLEEQDPDAEVLLMTQSHWPFETAICGVASRQDFTEEDEDEREESRYAAGTAPADVFLVEGEQLRYGSKVAWRVATR